MKTKSCMLVLLVGLFGPALRAEAGYINSFSALITANFTVGADDGRVDGFTDPVTPNATKNRAGTGMVVDAGSISSDHGERSISLKLNPDDIKGTAMGPAFGLVSISEQGMSYTMKLTNTLNQADTVLFDLNYGVTLITEHGGPVSEKAHALIQFNLDGKAFGDPAFDRSISGNSSISFNNGEQSVTFMIPAKGSRTLSIFGKVDGFAETAPTPEPSSLTMCGVATFSLASFLGLRRRWNLPARN